MKEFTIKKQALNNPKVDYQKELNEQQLEAVTEGDGPCLVLAGAGSGKTRTITYRVSYLIEHGVDPANILLLTFTNKAAKEMVERVEQLLGSYPNNLWGGTFHSIANRVLRKYAKKLGFESNFTILDQSDSKDLIKVCLKESGIDTKARRFPSAAVIQNLISYSRNAALSIEDAVDTKNPNFFDVSNKIEDIALMYADRKRAANSMDFDDLLILLLELLQNDPGVRDRLSSQFHYILVDEYQDTNVIQASIVHELASAHGNVFVVGDDAQSIYSFRAAEIKNILNFPKIFPETKTYRLTRNYRSTPDILDVANEVISKNQHQFRKELDAIIDRFEKPSLVPTSSANQEASYIAEQILDLRDEGLPMRNMAVLFRAAFHSRALEMELMKRDLPYEYRGGMKFFERAHVKDVISYLKLVENVKDEMAWYRVLGQQVGIGTVTAGKIIAVINGVQGLKDIWDIDAESKISSRAQMGWRAFCSIARKLLHAGDRPSEMIRALAASDYKSYLEAEHQDWMDRLEDIEQFAVFAEEYDDLTKFLGEVTLQDDYGAVREEASLDDERLILSTVHQSKGLEWDAVFVMNLTQGGFPNQRALNEDGGLEEERRLFYVASTRARKYLFLSYPATSGYDTLVINQPSMFLDEIPDELVEKVRVREEFSAPRAASRTSFGNSGYSEPTIVLDDDGEKKTKSAPKSFLRDIDELLF
jgi:DNA helicase II / ATP-dependent DNA helicase PcrA